MYLGNLFGHNFPAQLCLIPPVVHILHTAALKLESLYIDLLLLLSRGFLLSVWGRSVGLGEPWSISRLALSLQQYVKVDIFSNESFCSCSWNVINKYWFKLRHSVKIHAIRSIKGPKLCLLSSSTHLTSAIKTSQSITSIITAASLADRVIRLACFRKTL